MATQILLPAHQVPRLSGWVRTLQLLLSLILALLAIVIPSGWTFNHLFRESRIEGYGAFLGSAVLRPIRVNDTDGIILWLHTDPAFENKLRPVVTIPDLAEGDVQSGFVAIQGHGEVLRGEHYLLVEGVRQWIPTEVFVSEVRRWLGYDAQILLLACNPDHVRIDIPNTIYWQDNLVDVTYGVGPWVLGKYYEGDPQNGLQRPVLSDSQPPLQIATPMEEAIAKLHAAIGAQDIPAAPAGSSAAGAALSDR